MSDERVCQIPAHAPTCTGQFHQDEFHVMEVTSGPPYEGEETKHISVFFPDLGNLTISYETRLGNDVRRPVLSFDFDTNMVDIIDPYGGDREIT